MTFNHEGHEGTKVNTYGMQSAKCKSQNEELNIAQAFFNLHFEI